MTQVTTMKSPSELRFQLIRRLRELVVALDQRVPHVERSGEAAIASDAAALRAKAMARIGELEAESLTHAYDIEPWS